MATIPYPLTANDFESLKTQVSWLLRDLYEERLAGLSTGDVFASTGDTLELQLLATGGLKKVDGELAIKCSPTGNLTTGLTGLYINGSAIFKVGSLTRDMTAVTGNVGYTGLGFTPVAIIFYATVSGVAGLASWGFSDVTTQVNIAGNPALAWSFIVGGATCIKLYSKASPITGQDALIASLDADGFTLTWTKQGTPGARTANVYYLAMRAG